jgi:4-amino-4-deoxy-L-arabinose transferase-like glycosyltransferase
MEWKGVDVMAGAALNRRAGERVRLLLTLAALLVLPMMVVRASLPSVAWRPGADEGYFLHYSSRVAERGLGELHVLFAEYLAGGDRVYFPSPLRLTTILVDALAIRIGGPRFESLQAVAFVSFLVLLALVFLEVRRAFGERTALWTAFLLSVSPLHLAMARRALSDSLIATLMLVCVGLTVRGLAERRGPRWWTGIAAACTVTFLARELNLFLVPVLLALILLHTLRRRTWPSLWSLSAVSIVPLAFAVAIAALAAGGVTTAWQALRATVAQEALNEYIVRFGGGPWFRYVLDYLLVSPWTTLAYVAWLGWLAAARDADDEAWAWALVPILVVAVLAPFSKSLRYVVALEAPMRLGAVLLLQRALGDRNGARLATAGMAAALLAVAWIDLHAFRGLFVDAQTYDPATFNLLLWRRLLP